MKCKLLLLLFSAFLTVFLTAPVLAQASASMSAPIIRSAEGTVQMTVHFTNFVPDSNYRIGLGIAGDVTPDVNLELEEKDAPVSKEPVEFVQKNTDHWWGVPQLSARGYALSAADLSGEGRDLVLRMAVPRELAEKAGKLYIFVSRDYGANTWYLEDGSEIDESNW